MAINLMAPKGSDETAKMSSEIWKKIDEVKKQKSQKKDVKQQEVRKMSK